MSVDSEMVGMLTRDARRYRDAGNNLAKAALHVIDNFDGVHRLALAVSQWAIAVASEGDRPPATTPADGGA